MTMFWNRTKNQASSKHSGNVRKTTWRPEHKPNLLDRASAAIPDQTKAYERLKRNRTMSFARTAAQAPPPLNEAERAATRVFPRTPPFAPNAPAPLAQDLTPEEPFDMSVSDIAQPPPVVSPNALAPSDEAASPPDNPPPPATPPQRQRKRHWRWSVWWLWLLLLAVGWLLDPLFWQVWRSHEALASDTKVVIITVEGDDPANISEELFFSGLTRLLNSDAKVVGFVESPHFWLPNTDDNLTFERLSQYLERFPQVVIGLAADPKVRGATVNVVLEPRQYFRLPADEFAAVTPWQINPVDDNLQRMLPRVNLGFVERQIDEDRQSMRRFGTAPLLMPWQNPSEPKASGNTITNFLPAFATSVAMLAGERRPAHFRSGHTWWSPSMVAPQRLWQMRDDGRFAPLPLTGDAPLIIKWRDWVQNGRKSDIKDKIVLMGRAQPKSISLPTEPLLGWLLDRASQLAWSMKDLLANDLALSLPSRDFPKQPQLMWQALQVQNLMSGKSEALPNFTLHTLVSFGALWLTLLLGMVRRELILTLTLMMAGVTLWLSAMAGFAFASAGLSALILLPWLAWLNRSRDASKFAPTLTSEPNSPDLPPSSSQTPPSLSPTFNPYRASETTPMSETNYRSPLANLLAERTQPAIRQAPLTPLMPKAENNNLSTPTAQAWQRSTQTPATQSSRVATDAFKADMFSDRALSDQAQVAEDLYEDLQGKRSSQSPYPLPNTGARDDKLQWMREEERASRPSLHVLQDTARDDMTDPVRERTGADNWARENGQSLSQAVDDVVRPITAQLSPTIHGDGVMPQPHDPRDDTLPPQNLALDRTQNVDTQGFNQLISEQLENLAQTPPPRRDAALQAPAATDNVMHIGRYEVEKVLGRGAMGVVYLGLDPHINRKVAIKTVPMPDEGIKGENQQLAAKFFREAQAAGKLAHPGIVTVYDAGLYRQNVYIAMEYLEGRDLSAYIDAAKLLPLATTLNIIARVAEALHFAHERGVVHRDIKPANIIFDSSNNVVKVTDFGIAYIHDSNRAMTQVLVGSPNYMSPEHLTGEALDGRTDLFSLGVTLYVLLCGHTPFAGENVNRLMYSILNEVPRDIRSFNPNLPDAVVAILQRALQKDRQFRYSSGASMAQDLMIALKIIDKYP